MSNYHTPQSSKNKKKQSQTNSENFKKSTSKEDDFISGMNNILGSIQRVLITPSKKHTSKENVKMIDESEIFLSQSKDIQNEKDYQNLKRLLSPDKRLTSKSSKDQPSSIRISSPSLLSHFKEKSKNKVKTEDIEFSEVEDDYMNDRLRSRTHLKEETQMHHPTRMAAKALIRGISFVETARKVSETQKSHVKQLRKDNASHTSTYASMKNIVDNLAHDVDTINPKDPRFYYRLQFLMDKMTAEFNTWLVQGNIKVGKADRTIDKLENSICCNWTCVFRFTKQNS